MAHVHKRPVISLGVIAIIVQSPEKHNGILEKTFVEVVQKIGVKVVGRTN